MFERPSALPVNDRLLALVVLLVLSLPNANAQSINSATPVRLYYYDFKLTNPAFTGTNAKHAITSDYAGDPNEIGRSQMVFASYEANIKSIQSGIGVISSVQDLGIVRYTHYGLLYSKHLQVNEHSGFYFGTQLAYQRTRIDFGTLRLSDPTDPLISQPGIERTGGFNVAFGAAYYSPIATLGAAFKNVLIQNGNETPEYNVLVTRELHIAKNITATPSLLFVTDSKYNSLHINTLLNCFSGSW